MSAEPVRFEPRDPLIMILELAAELAAAEDPRLDDMVRQVNTKLRQAELERSWQR